MRIWRNVLTWTATSIILSICLAGILASQLWKNQVLSAYTDVTQPAALEQVMFYVLTFLPSLIIVVVNIILNVVVRRFTQLEKHLSETMYNTSVAFKLTIALFLNTAVIAVVVHWGDLYGPNGLVVEAYNILVANAVIQPICYIAGPKFIVKKLKQRIALWKGERCSLSQKEANLLFEGPSVDMPQRYAGFMKTCLLTLFYAPVMPASFVICLLALGIQYWVDKFMLLRVHARPTRLGASLNSSMQAFIPAGCAIYSTSSLYFFFSLGPSSWIAGFLSLFFSVLVLFVPIRRVAKVIGATKLLEVDIGKLSESDKPYDIAVLDFLDDYDRANPVTAQESTKLWLELLKVKRGDEAVKRANSFLSRKVIGNQGSGSLFEAEMTRETRRKGFVKHMRNEIQSTIGLATGREEEEAGTFGTRV